MSKYKLGFRIGDFYYGDSEIIDLVDDYDYSEEKAKEIIADENKQIELFVEWRNENVDQHCWVVESED